MSLSSERKRSAAARPGKPPAAPARSATEASASALPAELIARLGAGALETPEQCRAALAAAGLCDATQPPVTLELYGGLRLKAGCRALPLHAATVGAALAVLRAALPKVRRILPPEGALEGHYRFSLNGRAVTADPAHPLQAGDRLIVFNASVGG